MKEPTDYSWMMVDWSRKGGNTSSGTGCCSSFRPASLFLQNPLQLNRLCSAVSSLEKRRTADLFPIHHLKEARRDERCGWWVFWLVICHMENAVMLPWPPDYGV
jgi:hypothetical protein